jgi:hypothetical protein
VDTERPDETDERDDPEVVRPDAPLPPGVYVDPWDEPLDPRIIEPAEPLVPRAPERPDDD